MAKGGRERSAGITAVLSHFYTTNKKQKTTQGWIHEGPEARNTSPKSSQYLLYPANLPVRRVFTGALKRSATGRLRIRVRTSRRQSVESRSFSFKIGTHQFTRRDPTNGIAPYARPIAEIHRNGSINPVRTMK
jgi:hypothetical protein